MHRVNFVFGIENHCKHFFAVIVSNDGPAERGGAVRIRECAAVRRDRAVSDHSEFYDWDSVVHVVLSVGSSHTARSEEQSVVSGVGEVPSIKKTLKSDPPTTHRGLLESWLRWL